MNPVTSFRIVYNISLVFGTFPLKPQNLNSFHVSKKICGHAKRLFWILLIIRVILIGCEIHSYNNEFLKKVTSIFRVGNVCMLEILTIIAHQNVFICSNDICDWLNKMFNLYSAILGNFRKLYNWNCFVALYSLGFYSIINFPIVTVLHSNGKLISGVVASFDSAMFMFLLLLQNVYLIQFLAFSNLTRLCFSRINEILRNDMSRGEQPREFSRKIKKLRVQHLEVTDFCSFLNSVFEFYIFVYVVWSFLSVVTCSIGLVLFDFVDFITLYIWMWYHVFQNLPLLMACELISLESKRSAYRLNELTIQEDNPEVKEEVEIFSLQLQHRPVEFNVCGVFTLNRRLFVTVSGIVITYVITLIQTQSTAPLHETNSTSATKGL